MTSEQKASYDWCYDGRMYYRKHFAELKKLILDNVPHETLIEYLDTEFELRRIRQMKTVEEFSELLEDGIEEND